MLVNFDPKLLNDKILNLDKIMALNESDRKSSINQKLEKIHIK